MHEVKDNSLRVLNVEDSADDSLLLRRFMHRGGVTLRWKQVSSPAEFVASIEQEIWDVILADYAVPGFDAPEALQLLKQLGRDIPFIVVSGAVGEDAAATIMRAGANDFITKNHLARLLPAIERELHEADNRRERQRDQRARLESEAKLRAILENSPAGIYLKDCDGRYTIANQTCASIFGIAQSSMIGKDDTQLFKPEISEHFRTHDAEVALHRRACHREEASPLKDGRRFFSVRFPVFDAAGSLQGVGGIYSDISELKRTEEVLRRSEKLAAAGRLAATIAHEINNPLEAVVNLVFLALANDNLDERTRGFLQLAERELARVTHISKQTLGFYRESSAPTEIAVGELAAQVLDLYERKAQAKSLTVARNLDPSARVYGIGGEIMQVFSNLLANAIDASHFGGTVMVRVHQYGCANGGSGVRIVVADNGAGIPPDSLASIYEPFFTTKKDVGTGLGLWVTRQIVGNHGGRISVRTRSTGKLTGTVFRVVLQGCPHPAMLNTAEAS